MLPALFNACTILFLRLCARMPYSTYTDMSVQSIRKLKSVLAH